MKKLVFSLFALTVLAIAAVGFAMPPQDPDPVVCIEQSHGPTICYKK